MRGLQPAEVADAVSHDGGPVAVGTEVQVDASSVTIFGASTASHGPTRSHILACDC